MSFVLAKKETIFSVLAVTRFKFIDLRKRVEVLEKGISKISDMEKIFGNLDRKG